MSGSVNKVILIGRLGKDPVSRHTQDGKLIVSFSIATSENWKDKATGERKEKTEWHNISIFNEGLAKVAAQYLKKGSSCYVEGQLATRKWTDKDSIERYNTEVVLQNYGGNLVLLGDKQDGNESAASDEYKPAQKSSPAAQSFKRELDDEVPF